MARPVKLGAPSSGCSTLGVYMYESQIGNPLILDAPSPGDSSSDKTVYANMDAFLASVEKRAYVIARATCHDPQIALDIVQDSMFNMVKSYATKPADQWTPLFFRILNNRIADQHRKRGLGRLTQWFGERRDDEDAGPEPVDQLASDEFCPETLADSLELSESMSEALDHLTFKQQQTLILRLWQGLSVKETASAMGISEGSVKTHLSRAVHEMREHLQEYTSL